MTDRLTVVAAAIRLNDVVYSLPPPARHHDVGIDMVLNRGVPAPYPSGDAQGFLLSDGRFARRKAAMWVAIQAGQVDPDKLQTPAHGLFSEDLW